MAEVKWIKITTDVFDDEKIRQICNLDSAVRLVITIGYPKADDKLRTKKRKSMDELVSQL